ncbi:cytochrome c oxidase assembly protein [Novosphingobium lentum]|uniref:cytochrome c oxidase assembly protein n=1 Tax=Novosphingobium lentum TaxID=145287 RepID=UPI00082AC9FD|nr:cytochrome c oxidase assembly protein [Novosphingobium lentum]
MATRPPATIGQRNRKVGLIFAGIAAAMLGLGYASVPLYRLFCQATGYEGTPRRASELEARAVKSAGTSISIRFDANVNGGMPWDFRPEQTTQTETIGERKMAFFYAHNKSARPITGRASYNIEPEQAAKYFNKIQCFCFTEQRLLPGQEVKMPVIYFVDPAILKDAEAKDLPQITLSYTFNEVRDAEAPLVKPLDRAVSQR